MTEPPPSPDRHTVDSLKIPSPSERRDVLRRWNQAESGMDGARAGLPESPDDAVAFQLLHAAEAAMERGDWKRGANILKLVVRDYRESREAAFARRVIDRLAEHSTAQR